jgi:DNA repair protein RecN (Recombination protein N)
MLLELKIENFALVKDLEISFEPGFNVLTGESGSGKSLIVESLNFVLGGRIKSGRFLEGLATRVQAVFDVSSLQIDELKDLKETGIIDEESDSLVLMRKLTSSGRNLYFINSQAVPLNVYKTIGQALVDIHSQRDSQYLLDSSNQRKILDNASGEKALNFLDELANIYRNYKKSCE